MGQPIYIRSEGESYFVLGEVRHHVLYHTPTEVKTFFINRHQMADIILVETSRFDYLMQMMKDARDVVTESKS